MLLRLRLWKCVSLGPWSTYLLRANSNAQSYAYPDQTGFIIDLIVSWPAVLVHWSLSVRARKHIFRSKLVILICDAVSCWLTHRSGEMMIEPIKHKSPSETFFVSFRFVSVRSHVTGLTIHNSFLFNAHFFLAPPFIVFSVRAFFLLLFFFLLCSMYLFAAMPLSVCRVSSTASSLLDVLINLPYMALIIWWSVWRGWLLDVP